MTIIKSIVMKIEIDIDWFYLENLRQGSVENNNGCFNYQTKAVQVIVKIYVCSKHRKRKSLANIFY